MVAWAEERPWVSGEGRKNFKGFGGLKEEAFPSDPPNYDILA